MSENEIAEIENSIKRARQIEKDITEEIRQKDKQLKKLPKRGRPGKKKKELTDVIDNLKQKLKILQGEKEHPVTEKEYQDAKAGLERMPKLGRYSKRKAALKRIVHLYEEAKEGGINVSEANQKLIDDLQKKWMH